MTSKKNGWMQYFRLITPFLLLLFAIIGWLVKEDLTRINEKLEAIDHKMFTHLTNDELHMPRSLTVSKAEFLVYQDMRDKQISDIKEAVCDIRKSVERVMGKDRSSI